MSVIEHGIREKSASTKAKPVDSAGHSHPLGATVVAGGVNFSIYSRDASGVELLLFDREDDGHPTTRDPPRSGRESDESLLACLRPRREAGQLYGYRVHGPSDPARGMRFDPTKLLLDPYGRGVVVPRSYIASRSSGRRKYRDGDEERGHGSSTFDWEGDMPLQAPGSRTIIYEMHVRGFTRHPISGVAETKRGTYAGLIEKIPYLQISASQQSNCCRYSSSTLRIVHRDNQLLGLCAGFLFRAAPGLQLAAGSARPGRRVS